MRISLPGRLVLPGRRVGCPARLAGKAAQRRRLEAYLRFFAAGESARVLVLAEKPLERFDATTGIPMCGERMLSGEQTSGCGACDAWLRDLSKGESARALCLQDRWPAAPLFYRQAGRRWQSLPVWYALPAVKPMRFFPGRNAAATQDDCEPFAWSAALLAAALRVQAVLPLGRTARRFAQGPLSESLRALEQSVPVLPEVAKPSIKHAARFQASLEASLQAFGRLQAC